MNSTFRALVDLVARARVLSLDVFDTALVRHVGEPVDLFTLVARQYRHLKGDTTRPFNFAGARREAERRRRDAVWIAERRGDIGFDEIYQQLETPPDWSKEELAQLELDAELLVSRPNPWILALYREALKLGKPVIFVSDMYLPAPFIGQLLDRAGFGERAQLWVSSAEGGRSKTSGELYRQARERMGAGPGEILHLGDNAYSDFAMAIRHSVTPCLYERCGLVAERGRWRHPGEEPAAMIYRGLVHARLFAHRGAPEPLGAHYRFGYETLGLAWWRYGGALDDLTAALGASAFALELEASLGAAEPWAEQLRRGAQDFAADFDGYARHWTWLAPSWDCLTAPIFAFERAQRGNGARKHSLAERIRGHQR